MRFFLLIHIIFWTALLSISFGQDSDQAVKLSGAINSDYAERMPLISLDGKALYFARKAHPQNMGTENKDDIWVSYLNPQSQTWSKAINVGSPLNNDGHNFVVSLNASGTAMYLANDYHQNLKDAISYTTRNGRRWSTPFTLEIPDYKNKSPYVSYHVSKDERYLLISAEQGDTEGERDFYVCFKTNKGWSSPLNLGNDINSEEEENSIFLAADNKTVYFSSAGHGGMGGYDLFMSKRLDNTWTRWSKPKNLGPQFNTPSNDLSISIPASGDFAYLARGPIDNTDIYKIKIPEDLRPAPVTFIQAQLVDAETKKPVDGNIYFESLKENSDEERSIFNGQAANYIVDPHEDTGIYAQVDGYFPISTYYANEADNFEGIDSDIEAYYVNKELQSLQNKLDDIQRELKRLQSKKEEVNKSNKRRKSKSAKASRQSASNKSSTFKNVGEQENELDDLKSKYQQHFEEGNIPAKETEVSAKSSDSDALKSTREKYQQYYNQDEPSKEDTPVTNNTSAEINAYAVRIVNDMFGDYYPPIVKEVRKEEAVNLSTKDMVRLEEIIKLDISDTWIPLVSEQLSTRYKTKLDKETRLIFKRDLKDDFADALKTEASLLIKRQKEKNLKANILKQLDTPNKNIAPASDKLDKEIKAPIYQEIEKELSLIPLKKGAVLTLNNIFFEMNKATLKSQSESELRRIHQFLKSNPKLSIEIGGHTNGWCSPEFAVELSQDRSEAVYRYFIDEGISKNRLTYKGYGKSAPIATNDTKSGRRKNQRVELKILDITE